MYMHMYTSEMLNTLGKLEQTHQSGNRNSPVTALSKRYMYMYMYDGTAVVQFDDMIVSGLWKCDKVNTCAHIYM